MPHDKMSNDLYMPRATRSGLLLRISKTASGRGRKCAAWVVQRHEDLLDEFCRLQSCGVKFNSSFLLLVATKIVIDATDGPYGRTMREPKSGKLMSEHFSRKWVERFMAEKDIVCCVLMGKRSPSAQKTDSIESEVVFHLGFLKRGFSKKMFDVDCVFNADKTNYSVNLDDGHTLAMKGNTEVKYSDVVNGDMGMTIMVMIEGL